MFRKLYGSLLVLFSFFLMTSGAWSQTSILYNSVYSSLVTCLDSDRVKVLISSVSYAKLMRTSYNEYLFFVIYNNGAEKVFETIDSGIGLDRNYKRKSA